MKRLFILTICCLTSTAFAADHNFGARFQSPLLDINGQPVVEHGLPVTVGVVAGNCLANQRGKGAAYWTLANRLAHDKTLTLSDAEIASVRECEQDLAPIATGQIDPILNSPDEGK